MKPHRWLLFIASLPACGTEIEAPEQSTPTDIADTVRPPGSAPDVGPCEWVQAD